MNQNKIYRTLLLILGISIVISAPTLTLAADTASSGTTSSSSTDAKNGEKKDASTPSSDKGSGEKSGSGDKEPECN